MAVLDNILAKNPNWQEAILNGTIDLREVNHQIDQELQERYAGMTFDETNKDEVLNILGLSKAEESEKYNNAMAEHYGIQPLQNIYNNRIIDEPDIQSIIDNPSSQETINEYETARAKAFLQIFASAKFGEPTVLFPNYKSLENDTEYRRKLENFAEFNTENGLYHIKIRKILDAQNDENNPQSISDTLDFIFEQGLTTPPIGTRSFNQSEEKSARLDYIERLQFETDARDFADRITGRNPNQPPVYLINPAVATEAWPNPFVMLENGGKVAPYQNFPTIPQGEVKNKNYEANHAPVLVYPDARRYVEDPQYRDLVNQIARPVVIKKEGLLAFEIDPVNLPQVNDNGNYILKNNGRPQFYLENELIVNRMRTGQSKIDFIFSNDMHITPSITKMQESSKILETYLKVQKSFLVERNRQLAEELGVDTVKPSQIAYTPPSIKMNKNQAWDVDKRLGNKPVEQMNEQEKAEWNEFLNYKRLNMITSISKRQGKNGTEYYRRSFTSDIQERLHQDFPGRYATGGTIMEFIAQHKINEFQGQRKAFGERPKLLPLEDIAAKIGYDELIEMAADMPETSEWLGEVSSADIKRIDSVGNFYRTNLKGQETNGGVSVHYSGVISIFSYRDGSYTFGSGKKSMLHPKIQDVIDDYYKGDYSNISDFLDKNTYDEWVARQYTTTQPIDNSQEQAAEFGDDIKQYMKENGVDYDPNTKSAEVSRERLQAEQKITQEIHRQQLRDFIDAAFNKGGMANINDKMVDSYYLAEKKGLFNLDIIGPDTIIIKDGVNAASKTLYEHSVELDNNGNYTAATDRSNRTHREYYKHKTDENGKSIISGRIKLKNNDILTALYQFNNEGTLDLAGGQVISSLRKKTPHGSLRYETPKNHLYGSEKSGAFTVLTGGGTQKTVKQLDKKELTNQTIIFVEGAMTGFDTAQANPNAIVVFFADIKNMHKVVPQWIERYKDDGHKFIIAADNDHIKEQKWGYFANAGKSNSAQLASELIKQYGDSVDITVALPDFNDAKQIVNNELKEEILNFNKRLQDIGITNVKEQVVDEKGLYNYREIERFAQGYTESSNYDAFLIAADARLLNEAISKAKSNFVTKGSDFNDLHQNVMQASISALRVQEHAQFDADMLNLPKMNNDRRINDILQRRERKSYYRSNMAQAEKGLFSEGVLHDVMGKYFGDSDESIAYRKQKTQELIEGYDKIMSIASEFDKLGLPLEKAKEISALAADGEFDIERLKSSLTEEYEAKAARPLNNKVVEPTALTFNDPKILSNNQHYGRLMLDVISIDEDEKGQVWAHGVINNSNISVDGGYQPKTASIRLDGDNERFRGLLGKRTDAQGTTYLGNSQLVLAFKELDLEEITVNKKTTEEFKDPNDPRNQYIMLKVADPNSPVNGKFNHYTLNNIHLKGTATDFLYVSATDVNVESNPKTYHNNSLATLTFVSKQKSNEHTSNSNAFVQIEELHSVTENVEHGVSRQEIFDFLVKGLEGKDFQGNPRRAQVSITPLDKVNGGIDNNKPSLYIRSDRAEFEQAIPVEGGGYIKSDIHPPLSGLDTLYNIVVRQDKRTRDAEQSLKPYKFDNLTPADRDVIKSVAYHSRHLEEVREFLYESGVTDLILRAKEAEFGLEPGSIGTAEECLKRDSDSLVKQARDMFMLELDEEEFGSEFEQSTVNNQGNYDVRLLGTTVYQLTGALNASIADRIQLETEQYEQKLISKPTPTMEMVNKGVFQPWSFTVDERMGDQNGAVIGMAASYTTSQFSDAAKAAFVWDKNKDSIAHLEQVLRKGNTQAAFIQVEGDPVRTPWLASSTDLSRYAPNTNQSVKLENVKALEKTIPGISKTNSFVRTAKVVEVALGGDPVALQQKNGVFYTDSEIRTIERRIKTQSLLPTDSDVVVDMLAKQAYQNSNMINLYKALNEVAKNSAGADGQLDPYNAALVKVTGAIIDRNTYISRELQRNKPVPTRIERMGQNEKMAQLFIGAIMNEETFDKMDSLLNNKQNLKLATLFQESAALRLTTKVANIGDKPKGYNAAQLMAVANGLTDENNFLAQKADLDRVSRVENDDNQLSIQGQFVDNTDNEPVIENNAANNQPTVVSEPQQDTPAPAEPNEPKGPIVDGSSIEEPQHSIKKIDLNGYEFAPSEALELYLEYNEIFPVNRERDFDTTQPREWLGINGSMTSMYRNEDGEYTLTILDSETFEPIVAQTYERSELENVSLEEIHQKIGARFSSKDQLLAPVTQHWVNLHIQEMRDDKMRQNGIDVDNDAVEDYQFAPGEAMDVFLKYNRINAVDENTWQSWDGYTQVKKTIDENGFASYEFDALDPMGELDYSQTNNRILRFTEDAIPLDSGTLEEIYLKINSHTHSTSHLGFLPVNEDYLRSYIAERVQAADNTVSNENASSMVNEPAVNTPAPTEPSEPTVNTPSEPQGPAAGEGQQDSLFSETEHIEPVSQDGYVAQSIGGEIIGRRTDKLAMITADTFAKKGLKAWGMKEIDKIKDPYVKAAGWMLRDSIPSKPTKTRTYASVSPLQKWAESAAEKHSLFTELYNGYNDIVNSQELSADEKSVRLRTIATDKLVRDAFPDILNSVESYSSIVSYFAKDTNLGGFKLGEHLTGLLKAEILSHLPEDQWKDIKIGTNRNKLDGDNDVEQVNPILIDVEKLSDVGGGVLSASKEKEADGFNNVNHYDEKFILSNDKSHYQKVYNFREVFGENSGKMLNRLLANYKERYGNALEDSSKNALVKGIADDEPNISQSQKNIGRVLQATIESTVIAPKMFMMANQNELLSHLDMQSEQNQELVNKYPLVHDPVLAKVQTGLYRNRQHIENMQVPGRSTGEIVTFKDSVPMNERRLFEVRAALNEAEQKRHNSFTLRYDFGVEELQQLSDKRVADGKKPIVIEQDGNIGYDIAAAANEWNLKDIGYGLTLEEKLAYKEELLEQFNENILEDALKAKANDRAARNNEKQTVSKRDVRTSLNEYERVGEDYTFDVNGETILKHFGFKGVEFSKTDYIKPEERATIVKNTLYAYSDMAKILGIPENAIGLGGELGLTVGRHGRGGGMLAFYDPRGLDDHGNGDKLPVGGYINVTRNKGLGTLCHEWGHALDNFLIDKDNVIGRSGFPSAFSPTKLQSLNMREELKSAYERINKGLYDSGMAKRSRKMEVKENRDYWSSPEELFARGFEAYVKEKGKQLGITNEYLVNFKSLDNFVATTGLSENLYPYPKEDEMDEIMSLYDNFFETLAQKDVELSAKIEINEQGQTKEISFASTALFSRSAVEDKPKTGIYGFEKRSQEALKEIQADSKKLMVYDTLAERFGEQNINNLLGRGLLEISTKQDCKDKGFVKSIDELKNTEGYYMDGKSVLIADNQTAQTAAAVLLHELAGHHGFQNLMTKAAYADVMKDVHKLINDGNPVALRAKALAERESTPARQELELLPYLLSEYDKEQNQSYKSDVEKLIEKTTSEMRVFMRYNYGFDAALTPSDLAVMADGAIKNMSSEFKAYDNKPVEKRFSMAMPAQDEPEDIQGPITKLTPNAAFRVVYGELERTNDQRLLGITDSTGRTHHFNFVDFTKEDYAPAKLNRDISTVKNPDIYHFLQNGGTIEKSQAAVAQLAVNKANEFENTQTVENTQVVENTQSENTSAIEQPTIENTTSVVNTASEQSQSAKIVVEQTAQNSVINSNAPTTYVEGGGLQAYKDKNHVESFNQRFKHDNSKSYAYENDKPSYLEIMKTDDEYYFLLVDVELDKEYKVQSDYRANYGRDWNAYKGKEVSYTDRIIDKVHFDREVIEKATPEEIHAALVQLNFGKGQAELEPVNEFDVDAFIANSNKPTVLEIGKSMQSRLDSLNSNVEYVDETPVYENGEGLAAYSKENNIGQMGGSNPFYYGTSRKDARENNKPYFIDIWEIDDEIVFNVIDYSLEQQRNKGNTNISIAATVADTVTLNKDAVRAANPEQIHAALTQLDFGRGMVELNPVNEFDVASTIESQGVANLIKRTDAMQARLAEYQHEKEINSQVYSNGEAFEDYLSKNGVIVSDDPNAKMFARGRPDSQRPHIAVGVFVGKDKQSDNEVYQVCVYDITDPKNSRGIDMIELDKASVDKATPEQIHAAFTEFKFGKGEVEFAPIRKFRNIDRYINNKEQRALIVPNERQAKRLNATIDELGPKEQSNTVDTPANEQPNQSTLPVEQAQSKTASNQYGVLNNYLEKNGLIAANHEDKPTDPMALIASGNVSKQDPHLTMEVFEHDKNTIAFVLTDTTDPKNYLGVDVAFLNKSGVQNASAEQIHAALVELDFGKDRYKPTPLESFDVQEFITHNDKPSIIADNKAMNERLEARKAKLADEAAKNFDPKTAYIDIQPLEKALNKDDYKRFNEVAMSGLKFPSIAEKVADVMVIYGQTQEAMKIIDEGVEKALGIVNNQEAQDALIEFKTRILANNEANGSNPTPTDYGMHENYGKILLTNIVQKATQPGKDNNGIRAMKTINEILAAKTPDFDLALAKEALGNKVVQKTQYENDFVRAASQKIRNGELLGIEEQDMVIEVMAAQYRDYPQATKRLLHGAQKSIEEHLDDKQSPSDKEKEVSITAQLEMVKLHKSLYELSQIGFGKGSGGVRELVNSHVRHELVASIMSANMNAEQASDLANKTEYVSYAEKLDSQSQIPGEPTDSKELADYREIVRIERMIGNGQKDIVYSLEKQEQAIQNLAQINEKVGGVVKSYWENVYADINNNDNDVNTPADEPKTQPSASEVEIFSKQVGQGGVFDVNVQNYVKAYLNNEKETVEKLKSQVAYFKDGNVNEIVNEFIDVAAYDKAVNDHLRRALTDADVSAGYNLSNRPTSQGLVGNDNFKQVAVVATAAVMAVAKESHYARLSGRDADLDAESNVLDSLRRKEYNHQVHGKNGTLRQFEPVLIEAAKQVDLANRHDFGLVLNVESKPAAPVIDNNNNTMYNDSPTDKQAKTLLAAISISVADEKYPQRMAEKLHTRDIIESSLKAIGTDEALKFIKLMKATNPNLEHYKTLEISGNMVNKPQTRIDAFGLIKGMLNESQGNLEEKTERIFNHATRYGSWGRDNDLIKQNASEIKERLIDAPVAQINSDFSFLGRANKLMEELNQVENVTNRYINSKILGEYKPTANPENQALVFKAALNEAETGMDVKKDILLEAVKIRASNDEDFAKTAKLLSSISVSDKGIELGKLLDEHKPNPIQLAQENWTTIQRLSDIALVKTVSTTDKITPYQRERNFESIAQIASKIANDTQMSNRIAEMQAVNQRLSKNEQRLQTQANVIDVDIVTPKVEKEIDQRNDYNNGPSI